MDPVKSVRIACGVLFLAAASSAQASPLLLYATVQDSLLMYQVRSDKFLEVVGTFPGVTIGSGSDDLTLGPDGALYVHGPGGGGAQGRIWRIDVDPGTAEPAVEFGPEVDRAPGGFAFGADNLLYVTMGDSVLRYDPVTGAFLGIVLTMPGISWGSYSDDLSLGPDGALYVHGPGGDGVQGRIWRIDVGPGTAEPAVEFGPEVDRAPGGFAFGADNLLYVTMGDSVLRYDPVTGAFLGVVLTMPGISCGSFSDDLSLGPDGALYSHGNDGFWRIDLDQASAREEVAFGPEVTVRPGGFVVLK